MFTTLVPFLVVFLTGLVVSLVLTPWGRARAHRHGVVVLPNERRPHRRPTARGGGVAAPRRRKTCPEPVRLVNELVIT